MTGRLQRWMDGYLGAWRSNHAEAVAALFAPDAVYDPQTAEGPWRGTDEIVAGWRQIGDTPGNWEFEWRPLVEVDDLAIVTGRTRYLDPPVAYRNLFVIRFDAEERCVDFTEWWIEEEP